jgi:hypothetical protein
LKSVDSIRNAVDTELANAKIHASEIANLIHKNVGLIDAANAPHLFAFDIKGLVLKNSDDLANVIALRVNTETQRKEAERERILAEESARLEREAEADRKVREAAEEMARQREQEEADRLEREQQAEVSQQGADALAYAVQAPAVQSSLNATIEKAATAAVASRGRRPIAFGVDTASKPDIGTPADDGARLTLGQINYRIAPVSISVAGLSTLGFEPASVVKAARMYRACDFEDICRAISEHILTAAEVTS